MSKPRDDLGTIWGQLQVLDLTNNQITETQQINRLWSQKIVKDKVIRVVAVSGNGLVQDDFEQEHYHVYVDCISDLKQIINKYSDYAKRLNQPLVDQCFDKDAQFSPSGMFDSPDMLSKKISFVKTSQTEKRPKKETSQEEFHKIVESTQQRQQKKISQIKQVYQSQIQVKKKRNNSFLESDSFRNNSYMKLTKSKSQTRNNLSIENRTKGSQKFGISPEKEKKSRSISSRLVKDTYITPRISSSQNHYYGIKGNNSKGQYMSTTQKTSTKVKSYSKLSFHKKLTEAFDSQYESFFKPKEQAKYTRKNTTIVQKAKSPETLEMKPRSISKTQKLKTEQKISKSRRINQHGSPDLITGTQPKKLDYKMKAGVKKAFLDFNKFSQPMSSARSSNKRSLNNSQTSSKQKGKLATSFTSKRLTTQLNVSESKQVRKKFTKASPRVTQQKQNDKYVLQKYSQKLTNTSQTLAASKRQSDSAQRVLQEEQEQEERQPDIQQATCAAAVPVCQNMKKAFSQTQTNVSKPSIQ